MGIYAYKRDALTRFVNLVPSPLELREKLEQLRALGAGIKRVERQLADVFATHPDRAIFLGRAIAAQNELPCAAYPGISVARMRLLDGARGAAVLVLTAQRPRGEDAPMPGVDGFVTSYVSTFSAGHNQ